MRIFRVRGVHVLPEVPGLFVWQSLQHPLTEAGVLAIEEAFEKMHKGVPLTDEDRWLWLDAVAAWIDKTRSAGGHGVIACSVLKRRYRDILIGDRREA